MTVKTLTILVVLLCLIKFIMNQNEKDECGGSLSYKPFSNPLAGIAYYSRCSYPTYKMNVSCILSSCPNLNGVCPLTSTGSVNQATLSTAVSILNTCLGQNGLICGIDMNHIPLVQISWNTDELIPSTIANGNVSLNPGTGYLSNLPKAKITVPKTIDHNGNIILTIDAIDIVSDTYCNCDFSIPTASAFNYILPFSNLLYFPNMRGVYHLNLSSTLTLDLSIQPPTFNTHVNQFDLVSAFTNFVNQAGVALPDIAETFFNKGMNFFLNKSVLNSTAATFLSTYAALSLQAAQQNCP